jgi:predicted nucleic acid-binding protein
MIYLDASALFSLYLPDANTPAAISLTTAADAPLLITPLCELETVNAFRLRVFRKELPALSVENAVRDLEGDIRSGVLLLRPLPEGSFSRAGILAKALTPAIGVRAVDLLHVAAALELSVGSFYTFDQKQHRTAQTAGLKTNPLP